MSALKILLATGLLSAATTAFAADWPCFSGPNHDGISPDRSVATTWPEGGPTVLWRREIGAGFSSFAVVGGRVFTCGTENKQQALFCLNASDGEIVWKRLFEPEMTDPDPNLHGPRATPTVDDGLVYMMGSHGLVLCVEAQGGREVWRRVLKGKPHWGYSGSVLIEGRLAIVSAGGEDGALCALNKRTGEIVWKCGDDPAAYSTPYAFALDGRRYVCGFMAESVVVAELDTGRRVLRFGWPSHSGVNAATPIFHDGHLFISSGYGYGAGLFKLSREGEQLAAKEVWRNTKLRNKFQTPILLQGKLYTSDENGLKCVDFLTGKRLWRMGDIRHGTLVAVGEHLLLLTETGEMKVAVASPSGFEPISSAKLFEGTSFGVLQRLARQRQGARCWTVPVLVDGKLYVRDHTTVLCLDLRHRPEQSEAEAPGRAAGMVRP